MFSQKRVRTRWACLGPLVPHHSTVTVPLRICTCSHFLLFVWGGLALGWYWAKLEHPSLQKTKEEKCNKNNNHHPGIVGLTSQTATPPALVFAGRTCNFQVCVKRSDGCGGRWRLRDVRWVVMMAGDWSAVFSFLLAPCFTSAFLPCSLPLLTSLLKDRSVGNLQPEWRGDIFYGYSDIWMGSPVSLHRHLSSHWDGWGEERFSRAASALMNDGARKA